MHKKGFTLVELITVIAILATLLVIFIPRVSVFTLNLYLDASAKAVAANLRNLQSQAITKHQTTSLSLESLALPSQIQIISASNISFASSGFPPPGGSGSILLETRFGKSKKIVVSSSGRVRIE